MYLIIFYRENNPKHLVYHLNRTMPFEFDVGEYNRYSWLVLAKLVLHNGVFINKDSYKISLLQEREKKQEENRRRAKKIEKRNKIISFLESLKNGI